MKRVTIAALAIAAMVGCTKEDSYTSEVGSDVVKFSSAAIDNTRVSSDGKTWDAGEEIGISMYNVDSSNAESLDKTGNARYVSDNEDAGESSVGFEAYDDAQMLLYPNSGDVKFYAYYPWTDSTGNTLKIDVTDQSENLDFMVASTPSKVDRYTGDIPLEFSHKMAKITITITGNDNVTSVEDVTASVLGLSTTASYYTRPVDTYSPGDSAGDAAGSDKAIEFSMSYTDPAEDGDPIIEATATAIVHTETFAASTAKVTFTLPVEGDDDRLFNIWFPASEFTAGNNYCYEVALGNDAPEFSGSTIKGWDGSDNGSLYSEEIISFADANFKSALVGSGNSIDSNSDGEISYTEAMAFTSSIYIESEEISSMAEIKYFPNITALHCSNNSLTELDLSALTALTSLFCDGNSLTELDLSACTGLRTICCYSNRLSKLDVTMCPNIGKSASSGTYYESNFYVGNQTSDGSDSQDITVYVTSEQQAYITIALTSGLNKGVTLSTEK